MSAERVVPGAPAPNSAFATVVRIAVLVAAVAALVSALGSCGSAPRVSSAVARDPAAYSEDARLVEIDRLDRIIAGEMGDLGLKRAEPADDTTLATKPIDFTALTVGESAPAPPDSDDGGYVDDASRPSPTVEATSSGSWGTSRSWCDQVCDSARAICSAADKICRIADSMPGHPTARDRCTRARGDCTTAKDSARACDCRGL